MSDGDKKLFQRVKERNTELHGENVYWDGGRVTGDRWPVTVEGGKLQTDDCRLNTEDWTLPPRII